ncbi:hypothetical protein EMCRGX_G018197 [Ephydatia muelleri]|eukprot:Em0012g573a
MKYFFAVVLLTWLQLGTALPSFNSVEARLQKLEDFVDRLKAEEELGAEMEETDWTPKEIVVELESDETEIANEEYETREETVVEQKVNPAVSGCDSDIAKYITDYFKTLTDEFPQQFTSIKVTCGRCSTLSLEGKWSGLVTLCKSQKGTPCISRLQKATCFDLYPDDDMILPFRMPVDGTSTIAVVNLVLKNDSKQCFTLENPSAYMQCAKH